MGTLSERENRLITMDSGTLLAVISVSADMAGVDEPTSRKMLDLLEIVLLGLPPRAPAVPPLTLEQAAAIYNPTAVDWE